MVNSTAFAERLQKIMDRYTLTATSFADKIGFNRSTLSHLLSGRNRPSLEFVMKVNEVFPGVKILWLLYGEGHFPAGEHHEISEKTIPAATPKSEKTAENTGPGTQSTLQFPPTEGPEIDRVVIFFKNGSFKTYQNG
ncbi:MAG: helix-turn-helix domain-containing protein [Marinirhabdus sp.]